MAGVLITTVDPRGWDDGIDEIVGPFETEADANKWLETNPLGGGLGTNVVRVA